MEKTIEKQSPIQDRILGDRKQDQARWVSRPTPPRPLKGAVLALPAPPAIVGVLPPSVRPRPRPPL